MSAGNAIALRRQTEPAESGEGGIVPPHNDEAEMALLGALLQNNRAYERVAEFLKPEHFANRIHGRLFEAIGKLIGSGRIADQITLRQFFDGDGDLAEVGGWQYIMQVSHSVVSIINAGDYGRTIHDLYLRRELVDLGEEIVNGALGGDLDSDAGAQIEMAERRLMQLAHDAAAEEEPRSLAQIAPTYLSQVQEVARATATGGYVGVSTGIRELDKLTGTLKPDRLYTIGARPSMGKTALLCTIAYNAARAGKKVLFFSLEMSAEQIFARLNAGISCIDTFRQHNELVETEVERLSECAATLEGLPIWIDDRPSLTLGQMRAKARRIKRQKGLDLIIGDHMHIVRADDPKRPRHEQLHQISFGFKAMSKELEVPVIAAAQLSRANEMRDDKRPGLSDLREAGGIEENTDTAILLHRDEYYLERAEPKQREGENEEKFIGRRADWTAALGKAKGKADILIPKSRDGRAGAALLAFSGLQSRFHALQWQEDMV